MAVESVGKIGATAVLGSYTARRYSLSAVTLVTMQNGVHMLLLYRSGAKVVWRRHRYGGMAPLVHTAPVPRYH